MATTRPVVLRIDGNVKGLEAALQRLDARVARSQRHAEGFGKALGVAFAAGGAVQGLRSVITTAADFDTTIREAGAAAGASQKQVAQLGQAARKSGLEQKVGAKDAATAYRELIRAGVSVPKTLGGAADAVLKLGAASGANIETTSGAVASALNVFKLGGDQATKVADQFTTVANETQASVEDVAMAFQQGASGAKLLGMSLADTNVTLAALANIGVKGSDAGTSLKTAFLKIANPAEDAVVTMRRYNLEFFKANGSVKSAVEISAMLEKQLGGLNNQQRTQVLQTIAGTDGFRTLAALYGEGAKGAAKLERAMQRQGVAARQAAERNAGVGGTVREASAAWQEAKLQIAEVAAPIVTRELKKFSEAIKEADQNGTLQAGLKDLGTVLEGVAEAGETVATVGAGLASAWAKVPGPIREAAIAFLALSTITRRVAGMGGIQLGGGIGGAGGRGGATMLPGGFGRAPKGFAGATFRDTYAIQRGVYGDSRFGALTTAAGRIGAGRAAAGVGLAAGAGAIGTAIGGSFLQKVAAGAAVGSVGGPWGAAGGAFAAAAAAGLQGLFDGADNEKITRNLERVQNGTGRGLGREAQQRLAVARQRAEAASGNADYSPSGERFRPLKRRPGQGAAFRDRMDAEATRRQTEYGRAVGREQVAGLIGGGGRMSASLLAAQFKDRAPAEAAARKAAAAAWIAYIGEQERQGKAAKGAARKFAESIGVEMERGLREKVAKVDLRTAWSKVAGKSRGALAGVLKGQEKEFAGLTKATDTSFRGIEQAARRRLGELQTIMRDTAGTSKSTRQQAAREYRLLRDALNRYIGDSARIFGPLNEALNGVVSRAANAKTALSNLRADSLFSGVGSAVKELISPKRRGGLAGFAGGGLVGIAASPGEMVVEPSGRAYMIGGQPVAADERRMRVPAGAAILTGHGQSMLAGGASLAEALAGQMPHFAAGGLVPEAFRNAWERQRKSTSLPEILARRFGYDKSVKVKGGLKQWLWQALQITGKYSPENLAALTRRAKLESGGNPKAINLWDSNAKRGTPSKGLLQTIDPTFNKYKLPGMGNIWNPIHNAVAAIRYMYARYGHIVDANGKGYRAGGVVGQLARRPRLLTGGRGRSLNLPGSTSKAGFEAFASAIDELTSSALLSAASAAAEVIRTSKSPQTRKTARAALSLIDDRLGARASVAFANADQSVSQFQGLLAATEAAQRIRRVDANSQRGVSERQMQYTRFLSGAQAQDVQLTRALSIARKRGDKDTVREAEDRLREFRDTVTEARASLADLNAAQRVAFQTQDDLDAALARLTATTDDDNAVQQRRIANTETALQQALAAGDTEQATQLANTLADLRDSARATSDNTAQLTELMQQIKDGQDAIQRNMAAMDVQALLGQALSTWQGAMVAQTVGFGTPNGSRY